MPTLPDVHQRGTRANQPLATAVTIGTLYFVTDEDVTERSNGSAWESYSGTGALRAARASPDDDATTLAALYAEVVALRARVQALEEEVL